MKYLSMTLCLAVSVLALAACETSSSYDSGASYAGTRTAGDTVIEASKKPSKTQKVYKSHISK